jgi:hypothetical protein
MDAVEPYVPLGQLFQFKEGAWVDFNKPEARDEPKRRGHIIHMGDLYASVIDEHTFVEVCDLLDPEHS